MDDDELMTRQTCDQLGRSQLLDKSGFFPCPGSIPSPTSHAVFEFMREQRDSDDDDGEFIHIQLGPFQNHSPESTGSDVCQNLFLQVQSIEIRK